MSQEKPVPLDPIKRGISLPPEVNTPEESPVKEDSFSLEDLLKIFFGIDT